MTKENKSKNSSFIIDINGKKGETILYTPLPPLYDMSQGKELVERWKKMLNHYQKLNDDRIVVLTGALIIENELDYLLSNWISDYKRLMDNREFTFSTKVELCLSFKLIPNKILNGIKPIRQIRNLFAHNLEIKTFEEAKRFNKTSEAYFRSLKDTSRKMVLVDKQENDRAIFSNSVQAISHALLWYSPKVKKLKDYIWKEAMENKEFNVDEK